MTAALLLDRFDFHPKSPYRQTCNELISRGFREFGAEAELLQFPLEYVAELRLLVHAQLVLLMIADGARRQSFDDHFLLVMHPGIGSRFRCRRKPPGEVFRQSGCEFVQFTCLQEFENRHSSPPLRKVQALWFRSTQPAKGDRDLMIAQPKRKAPRCSSSHSGIIGSAEPFLDDIWHCDVNLRLAHGDNSIHPSSATSTSISSGIASSAKTVFAAKGSDARRLKFPELNKGVSIPQQR